MAEVTERERPLEVRAFVERGPSRDDPLAQRIRLALEFRGCEDITVDDPGYKYGDIREAMHGRPSRAQAEAIAKATYEAADRVYTMIFEAMHKGLYGSEPAKGLGGYKPEHPTVKLRKEIEGLKKELEDVTARLATAETQRDELRRLFAEPETKITGFGVDIASSDIAP